MEGWTGVGFGVVLRSVVLCSVKYMDIVNWTDQVIYFYLIYEYEIVLIDHQDDKRVGKESRSGCY